MVTKHTRIARFLSLIFVSFLFLFATTACEGVTTTMTTNPDLRNLTPQEFSLYNLVGTDALGRRIERVDGVKTDKERYVGLFYSVWLGQHPESQTGIYNITYMLETEDGRETLYDPLGSSESKTGEFHFWGEPLYGYYNMKDPWVLTRHIELLTMAGVDYLCIDATNNKVYIDSTTQLMDLLLNYQNQGFNVPKIVFYTNSYSGTTVDVIYSNFYQTEKYQSIWFQPEGKPLIIGITENNGNASDQTKYDPNFSSYVSSEMQEFFDVRESEWPNGDFNENSIPWMSWQYPQYIHNGSISVPVAQHSHSAICASYMHPESSRGYDNATKLIDPDFRAGRSFQTMWDTVHTHDDEISNVLVTSFNEWMAIKQNFGGQVAFVDVFSEEYSRDIEMMKGGYNDNFFLQLVDNIRRYKFESAETYTQKVMSIDVEDPNSIVMWDYVLSHYKDFSGDAMARDFAGAVPQVHYTDDSQRNDITDIKVVHDRNNLYFYVQTAEDITEYNGTDLNWMNIFLSTDSSLPGFSGYQFVINRTPEGNMTSVEKSTGGYAFESVGQAKIRVEGNVMQVAIPLSMLGLTFDNVHFEFKVADHVTNYEDIMDYYVTGDVAPLGRLNFGY